MSDLNRHTIIGRLGKDPELVQTTSGKSVCKFSVATGSSYKDRDGNKVETTHWHNVVTWEKLADLCGQYLAKGRQVYVEGRSETRSYEKDGVTKYMTELVANNVIFLGSKDGGSGQQQEQGSGQPKPSGSGDPGGQYDSEIPF
jgi:single-strand DNA-binding protein